MATTPDYYEVLQVSPSADAEVIDAAYRRLAKKWHPEKNPGDPVAAERIKLLNDAHAVLSDPHKRREYDSRRKQTGGVVDEAAPSGSSPVSDAESIGPLMWAIVALGTFLFVFAHGRLLLTEPIVFFGACLIWGLVFGLPAYLCRRFRMRAGLTMVAALFLLAAVGDAAAVVRDRSGAHSEIETAQPQQRKELPSDIHGPREERKSNGKWLDNTETLTTEPPKDADFYFKRALRTENRLMAIRDFQEAIRLDPKNPKYHFLCGDLWFKLAEYDLAIICYDRSIDLNPAIAEVYFWRSVAWSKKGDSGKSKKDFAEAHRLDPKQFP